MRILTTRRPGRAQNVEGRSRREVRQVFGSPEFMGPAARRNKVLPRTVTEVIIFGPDVLRAHAFRETMVAGPEGMLAHL
jgi:hypothetical protein